MSSTKLIILGSGTPNCLPERHQQSAAIVVGDQSYLIDCGGGTIQRIAQAEAMGISALHDAKLTRLFLTHLHPDHVVGLPDLMIAPWVKTRTEPLQIYGPKGTRKMVEHIQIAFEIGIGEHLNGLAPIEKQFIVEVFEYEEGVIYTDDNLSVEAFRVSHGGLDAFGLKIVTLDKTIVHSGDTCAVPIMSEQAKDADILIHEVYCKASLDQRDAGWQAYHRAAHTSTVELADIANAARPKLLVLNHTMTWGLQPDEMLLEEIAALYDGEVVLGEDLMVFE